MTRNRIAQPARVPRVPLVLPIALLAVLAGFGSIGCGMSQEYLDTALEEQRTELQADLDQKHAAHVAELAQQVEQALERLATARQDAIDAVDGLRDQYRDQATEIQQLKIMREGLVSDRQQYRESLIALRGVIQTNLSAVAEERRFLQERLDSIEYLIDALEEALRQTEEIVPPDGD